jgi:hypothetical protein
VVGRARVFRRTAPRNLVTWYNQTAQEDQVVEDAAMVTR